MITGIVPFRIKCDRIECAGPSTSSCTYASTTEASHCTLTEFLLSFYLLLKTTAKRLQHFNATYRNIDERNMLPAFGYSVATSCENEWKMVKFFMQHLWMLYDVVFVCQVPCFLYSTFRNKNEMWRSLGRSLQILGQECCDSLSYHDPF